MNKYGRKGAVKFNSAFILAGSLLMTIAWSAELLIAGRCACLSITQRPGIASVVPVTFRSSDVMTVLLRFVIGIGAGIAMCVGPIFLSEIAPQKIKGSVGVMNQLVSISVSS